MSSTGVDDESLMGRYQRGDRGAFSSIVRRHQGPLYNFVLRQHRTPAVAEDIVQEAFLRVVQNAQDFKQEAKFTTWLYTIARNLCIDQLRKNSLRKHPSLDEPRTRDGGEGPTLGDQTADTHVDANVERAAAGNELKARLERAVSALPDDQREVFLLREVANLPFKEIAQVTETAENTVKSRMRYALERLQSALADYEDDARALK